MADKLSPSSVIEGALAPKLSDLQIPKSEVLPNEAEPEKEEVSPSKPVKIMLRSVKGGVIIEHESGAGKKKSSDEFVVSSMDDLLDHMREYASPFFPEAKEPLKEAEETPKEEELESPKKEAAEQAMGTEAPRNLKEPEGAATPPQEPEGREA